MSVYSFGAAREILFKSKPTRVPGGDVAEVVKLLLKSASLLVMPEGMQHVD